MSESQPSKKSAVVRNALLFSALLGLLSFSLMIETAVLAEDTSLGIRQAASCDEPDLVGGGEEDKKSEAPEFKSKSALGNYEKALEAFEGGNYKRAAGLFKKASRSAKTPEGKMLVLQWYNASLAGRTLSTIEIMAKRGAKVEAFFRAIEGKQKVIGTPIQARFSELARNLSNGVYQVIEDFEHPKGAYSEKYGKKHITEQGKVFHGRGCIRWAQTPDNKGFQIRIGNVPKNWTLYEGIAFWVNAEEPSPLEIIATSPGKSTNPLTGKKSAKQSNVHLAKYTPKKKGVWTRVFIGLRDFTKHGNASLSNVDGLTLQASSKGQFAIYVDYIGLVYKQEKRGR